MGCFFKQQMLVLKSGRNKYITVTFAEHWALLVPLPSARVIVSKFLESSGDSGKQPSNQNCVTGGGGVINCKRLLQGVPPEWRDSFSLGGRGSKEVSLDTHVYVNPEMCSSERTAAALDISEARFDLTLLPLYAKCKTMSYCTCIVLTENGDHTYRLGVH